MLGLVFCRQQHVDMASYSLRFGYMYDLSKHLDGQPLLIMAKDEQSGKYLYNFAVWHERLFPAQQQAARQRPVTTSSDSSVTASDSSTTSAASRNRSKTSGAGMSGSAAALNGRQTTGKTAQLLPNTSSLQPQATVITTACPEASVPDGLNSESEDVVPSGVDLRSGASTQAVAEGTSAGQVNGLDSANVSSHQIPARRGWGQPRLTRPGLESVLAIMSDDEDGSSEDTHGDV